MTQTLKLMRVMYLTKNIWTFYESNLTLYYKMYHNLFNIIYLYVIAVNLNTLL